MMGVLVLKAVRHIVGGIQDPVLSELLTLKLCLPWYLS